MVLTFSTSGSLIGSAVTTYTQSAVTIGGHPEAFRFTAAETGTIESLRFLTNNSTNTATSLQLGIYSANFATQLGGGSVSGTEGAGKVIATNAWATVTGLSIPVVAGTEYNLVVLPLGGVVFYNAAVTSGGTKMWSSSKSELTELPPGGETWIEGGARGPVAFQGLGPGLTFPANGEGLRLFQFAPGEGPQAGLTFPANGEGLYFPVLPFVLPSDNMIGATGETPPSAGPGLVLAQNEYLLIEQNTPGPYQLIVEVLNWLTFDRNAFRRAVERYQPADALPALIQEVSVLA
jgi:hypothetical protein